MKKIYAFDFDGTLCQEAYPHIGKPNRHMIYLAKKLKCNGHKLILWTCRCGKSLEDAVDWCRSQGITFDAINSNLPETLQKYGTDSRKVTADYYVDDKGIGGINILLKLLL